MEKMLLKIYEKLLELSDTTKAISSKEIWECEVRRKITTVKKGMWPNDQSMKSTYAYIFENVKAMYGYSSIENVISEYEAKYPNQKVYTMNAMLSSSKGLYMLETALDFIIEEGKDVFNFNR